MLWAYLLGNKEKEWCFNKASKVCRSCLPFILLDALVGAFKSSIRENKPIELPKLEPVTPIFTLFSSAKVCKSVNKGCRTLVLNNCS